MKDIISRFPEDIYRALDQREYLLRVARGYRKCSRSTVDILGLARDLGKTCPYTIARINRIGRMFADYRVFILENDSADNTAHRLNREAAANPRWRVLSQTMNAEKHAQTREEGRARRMAEYRNRLMDFARQKENFDYTIIVDTDLLGGYSYDGIAHTFSLPNWDMVGSNSIIYETVEDKIVRLYYDSWAFRRLGCISAHSDEDINTLRFNRGEPIMQVKSCFGGLGIYRSDVYFCGAQYSHKNELDEIDCDHVTLHTELIRRGYNNIYINPSQITLYSMNPNPYIL